MSSVVSQQIAVISSNISGINSNLSNITEYVHDKLGNDNKEYMRTDTQYVKDFMSQSLKVYTDVKMFGMSVGHVKSKNEFNYCIGTSSAVIDVNGNNNVDSTGKLINPVNAFGQPITDNTVKPFTDKSYIVSTSIGKIVYSTGLMAMVDRGIISLGDPVIKFFPEWQNMKVLKQKFFYDSSSNSVLGQRENDIPFKVADGQLTESVIVTLSDGLKDTIANFIVKGRVQKVDYNLLTEPYKTYATNKFIYYIEVLPIDLTIAKTYGTVAMAFSHQLGLGLNVPFNKLITSALYDRGVYSPNYASNGTKTGGSDITTLYPNGYSHAIWAKEILKAGLLSTMPGAVWEYDTSISFGIACCEIAYKQFYGLSTIKPMWQIVNELVIYPMNLQNDLLFKLPLDSVAKTNVINNICTHYAMNGNSAIKMNNLTLFERNYWSIHDLGSINFVIISIYSMKELAFMLANYGVDRKGKRILSKNAVISMCEKNYLGPNVDQYNGDEVPYDGNFARSFNVIFGTTESTTFGIGGQIFVPKFGKVMNSNGENCPYGFYSWIGAYGHALWVNPSEGKYFVSSHKMGNLTPIIQTVPSGKSSVQTITTYTRLDSSGNIIPAGANVPPRYNTFGLDQGLSLFID